MKTLLFQGIKSNPFVEINGDWVVLAIILYSPPAVTPARLSIIGNNKENIVADSNKVAD